MQRRISIRRIVGLVVALACSAATVYFGIEWQRNASVLHDMQHRELARFDVNFARRGTYEASFHARHALAHGVRAYIDTDASLASWPDLVGRVDIIEPTKDEILYTVPLPPDERWQPPADEGTHASLLRFSSIPDHALTIRVVVDEPATNVTHAEPQMVVKSLLSR